MGETILNSIFYYYLNPAWRKKEDKEYQGSWLGVLSFFLKKLVKPIVKPSKEEKGDWGWESKNVFFLGTLNQFLAFEALNVDQNKSALYTRFHNPPFQTSGYTFGVAPTKDLSFSETVDFFITFYKTWIGALRENRTVLINRLQAVYENYKHYRFYCSAFKESKPRRVVLFNDHSPFYRMILEAARHANIQTFYFPHAGVSDKFPPLKFDYAYLYSQSMVDTYKKCGDTKTRIEVLGCKKYIEMAHNQSFTEKQVLGVSFNSHMEEKAVNDYLEALRESGIEFIIRPHPELPIPVFKKQYKTYPSDKFSDPKEESPIDFLKRIGTLISPVTNMFLEAALCKVKGIQLLDSESKLNDNYGFIEKGLVRATVSSPKELLVYLNGEIDVELPQEEVVRYFTGPLDEKGFEDKLNAIPEFK